MYLPTGAFAPVPTPLAASGGFDPAALKAHLGWLKAEGLDGALILGTNGEFASFSIAERRAIAEAAAKADSGLQLMLNVGSCALPEAIELSALGADLGYGSVLCPPPGDFRGAPLAGQIDWFTHLLDASRLPTLLYHIPQVTGMPLTDELLNAVCVHERMAGVKDSTGDEAELKRILPRFRQGASYMVGHDKMVQFSQLLGGHGSISACASVVPDLVKSVERKPENQAKLNSVRNMLEKFGLGPAVKAILRKKGFGAYFTRPPLVGLEDTQANQLFAMLDMFKVVKW
jgi:4-hydroxy-tetrahydrodipicolinate synthase